MTEYQKEKAEFVSEILGPLLVSAGTGWTTAEYVIDENKDEWVWLINSYGERRNKISVTADSLSAIVSDVFKKL